MELEYKCMIQAKLIDCHHNQRLSVRLIGIANDLESTSMQNYMVDIIHLVDFHVMRRIRDVTSFPSECQIQRHRYNEEYNDLDITFLYMNIDDSYS